MDVLNEQFEYYLANQDDLVMRYTDRHIVIVDKTVVGDFDTETEAYRFASEKYEAGTFLIQHATPGNRDYTQTFHSRVG